jgi:hypothetical protein
MKCWNRYCNMYMHEKFLGRTVAHLLEGDVFMMFS